MSRVFRTFAFSCAVRVDSRRGRLLPAVHERSADDPYRASAITSARPPARVAPAWRSPAPSAPRVGSGSGLARRARSSFSRNTATASSACGILRTPSGRSGSRPSSFTSPNATGNLPPPRFASRPDRRLTRPCCRRGGPRPGEAGRGGTWDPGGRRRQLRYDRVVALGLTKSIVDDSEHPIVDARSRPGGHSARRCPARHPGRDACIYR